MKALVHKEIQMLKPAFGGALALAILPNFLFPTWYITGWLFMFGIMILGVSAFGREMGLKTMPFIMAQPLNRSSIWWTKISVLSVCTAVVSITWFVSTMNGRSGLIVEKWENDALEGFGLMSLMVVVLITGGIWMTLLVRQMAAAFWLAYLVPAVIVVCLEAMGGSDWLIYLSMCLHAVAAFYLARRQFLLMEDTAWTGGALTFSGSRTVVDTSSTTRKRIPWRTLFLKELKLHSFSLAGIAALTVVHIGVIALRRLGPEAFSKSTYFALQSFGLVWIVVPFVVGSQSVAEERQNGTLDGLLCLPVSRRAQFAIKLAFVVVLGGLLSAGLLCGTEAIGKSLDAGVAGGLGDFLDFGQTVFVFLAFSVVGIYASTLTRSVPQALAAGGVIMGVYMAIRKLADQEAFSELFGPRLWPSIADPALVLALVWLAYGNFKWIFESGRRWRQNIFTLVIVLLAASVAAATVYQRAWGLWEWTTPQEGAHGPAVIPPKRHVPLYSSGWNNIGVLLPGGKLWTGIFALTDRWNGSGKFATGSNWVDATGFANEMVAIRSDGTLWAFDKPGSNKLVQYGTETNWQSVVHFNQFTAVLLKRDGTLWTWGPMELWLNTYRLHGGRDPYWSLGTNNYAGEYPGLRSVFTPTRFHPESSWARIIGGFQCVYAWNINGEAWAFNRPDSGLKEWSAARLPNLDHLQFKASGTPELWIRDDGTLWWHRLWSQRLGNQPADANYANRPELLQIGKDADWEATSWGEEELLALKTDGSIWEWNVGRDRNIDEAFQKSPKRFGTHSDWVGLGGWNGQPTAVAADGSLWVWPRPRDQRNSNEWLAPRNGPTKVASIVGGNQLH